MIVGERDPFGFGQVVYHPASKAVGPGIRALLARGALNAGPPDARAIAGYATGQRLPGHTILSAFRAVPPGHQLLRTTAGWSIQPKLPGVVRGDLEVLLVDALRAAVGTDGRAAIALSGGLDSALLLSLLHAHGMRDVPIYVLATGMPGYDERDAALATARRLGMAATVVEVGAQDFIDTLPHAMRYLEEPLYNLHPVAKLLLARAMRRDGMTRAVTGDGADQVLARDVSADYLPLTRTLFEAEGVSLCPPFLAERVVSHLLSCPPDKEKTCLRELGRQYGVASVLVDGPKRRGLAPAMDLQPLLPAQRIAAQAAILGATPPTLSTDAQRVHWATLLLLLDDLGVAA